MMTAEPTAAMAPGSRREPTGTAALLVNGHGQYLLHLRDANKPIWQSGSWALPGGGREPGETLDDCVHRELREEAGLDLADLRPFAIIDSHDADGPILVYLGTWNGDPSTLSVTEGIMLRWTDAEQIPWLTMDPGTTAVIERHQADPHPAGRGQVEAIRVARAGSGSVLNGVGAHLYLEHEGRVLLGKRHPSCIYAPGMWHALAVH